MTLSQRHRLEMLGAIAKAPFKRQKSSVLRSFVGDQSFILGAFVKTPKTLFV